MRFIFLSCVFILSGLFFSNKSFAQQKKGILSTVVSYCGYAGKDNKVTRLDSCKIEVINAKASTPHYEVMKYSLVILKANGKSTFISVSFNELNDYLKNELLNLAPNDQVFINDIHVMTPQGEKTIEEGPNFIIIKP